MLKISTKTRYSLRALLEMYCSENQKIFQLGELAKHQDISRKYLENIFSLLKNRRIILSRTGKNGGFYLPTNNKHVSLLDILEALEGKASIVNCKEAHHECERIAFCPANGIWNEVNAAIKKTLASKSLKDLAFQKDIRRKCSRTIALAEKAPAKKHR